MSCGNINQCYIPVHPARAQAGFLHTQFLTLIMRLDNGLKIMPSSSILRVLVVLLIHNISGSNTMKLLAGLLGMFCWFIGSVLAFYSKEYVIGLLLIACAIVLVIVAEKANV
jgi:hypothetical protein